MATEQLHWRKLFVAVSVYVAVTTYCCYEKVGRTMLAAIASHLLNKLFRRFLKFQVIVYDLWSPDIVLSTFLLFAL